MNIDQKTVDHFGLEWKKFDQAILKEADAKEIFQNYFKIFPWENLPDKSVGFDMGCGSGRWAKFVAEHVFKLYCIDASALALDVAKENLRTSKNCAFYCADVDNLPLKNNSMDFGYSLGVLHHIPDTQKGIDSCVDKLKPGAPFLIYLYYAFDNRPAWFVGLWRISNGLRSAISKSPFWIKYVSSQIIATLAYYPLARLSLIGDKLGLNVSSWPLSFYRNKSFYIMKTDAFDRFGTRLEKRFTRKQIKQMLENAGLEKISFSSNEPYWCAVGFKKVAR